MGIYCKSCNYSFDPNIYWKCPRCFNDESSQIINIDINARNNKTDLKDYSSKLPMSSMQWKAFTSDKGVAGVFKFAMGKYGNVNSWRNRTPESLERYESALLRHYAKYKNGETIDPESGLHHFAAMAWNALTLLEFIIEDEGNKC